jgi:hypothetical protein
MPEQTETIQLENCSLEDVIAALLNGTPIGGRNIEDFQLSSSDSVKIFAYYAQHRDLWPRNRQVQSAEIDSLLRALESELPQASRSPRRAASAFSVWNLRRVEAHRYGGLHRHCGPLGEDPEPFTLEVDKDLTLISGFNGAGKTALLSSIIWCLTGKALRSQHKPDEVHEPISVEWTEDSAATEQHERSFAIPPIVPIPSASNLEALGDQPRLDTWVRLTFINEATGESRNVTRRLVAQSAQRVTMAVEGLAELGLTQLACEVGTVMPGIAAHMRFDEKTEFAPAIAQLTGLKPLEDLGKRAHRVINRLRGPEVRTAEENRRQRFAAFETKKRALVDAWQAQPDLGTPTSLASPGETMGGQQSAACIAAARSGLQTAQRQLTVALESIFGRRLEFAGKPEIEEMQERLNAAADQLKAAALGNLPSMAILKALGVFAKDDIAAAETLSADIMRRARALASRLEDRDQAARWQLYARVTAWHQEHHPGAEIANCPVCGTDLKGVPADAMVDMSVREALDHCRQEDADIAKTGAEWERDEAAAFLDELPESVRSFADRPLSTNLLELYQKAFVDELLSQQAFGGRLEPLKANGRVVWERASSANRLNAVPEMVDQTLPEMFRSGSLAARLSNVRRAIHLAKHRVQNVEPLESLVKRYVGAPRRPEAVESGDSAASRVVPNEAPLRDQIEMIRRAIQNAAPIVSLVRQLDELDAARQAWETENRRLELLERAATAIDPFLRFPELVYEQVSGLIETLDRGIAGWLQKLYRPHYCDGPDYSGFDATQEVGVGLRVGVGGGMRVQAHQIMNASLLRACVWAFLFSLWEHVRRQAGGLDCLLLDDPQTHFDPMNSENLAAAIVEMPSHGMHPIVTSNDTRFVASIQDKLPRSAVESPSWTALDLDPVSSSRLTALVSPAVEEIRERRDRWRDDRNSVSKAHAFVERVRTHVENRLWNLLATDPLVMHKPTLADLLNQLRGARTRGERPFDEPPFERLLDHPGLRPDAPFYKIINHAHHRLSGITPVDARDVESAFDGIEGLLRSCTASYARFMGRLTREDSDLVLVECPDAPPPMDVRVSEFTVLGQLSARSTGDRLAESERSETIELGSLAPLALYAIRAPTLGLLALPQQVALVAVEREARDGDPVIALSGDRTYARRLARDARDPSRIALIADRSGAERVPPAVILPSAKTLVMPIVGILFDQVAAEGREEAVLVPDSALLRRLRHAARVVDNSAYPVIRNGDVVLIEGIEDVALDTLEGRIVAVLTASADERFGFLKRMGQEVGRGLRIFENIGLEGRSVCIATSSQVRTVGTESLTLEKLWRVHGVLRLAGR